MKFTKLMALALALVMLVAVFAACGDTSDETEPESEKPVETQAPATESTTEPETECQHKVTKKTGNDKAATCTEEGYVERKCSKCGEIFHEPVEKLAHKYSEVKSVDGKYTKRICMMCKEESVIDEAGNVVADASKIEFPFFAATFEGVDELADYAGLFSGISFTPKFANIVKNNPNGEIYVNVPSGKADVAPNGYLELVDAEKKLVGSKFSITFQTKLDEYPAEKIALFSYSGTAIISIDISGALYDASGAKVGQVSGKGWDTFLVEFEADGSYTVNLEGAKIATGKVSASNSTFRFFDEKSMFEGYIDTIIIKK